MFNDGLHPVQCNKQYHYFIYRLHRELRTTIENQLEVLQQSDGINSKTQVQIDQLQQKMKRISDV